MAVVPTAPALLWVPEWFQSLAIWVHPLSVPTSGFLCLIRDLSDGYGLILPHPCAASLGT